MESALRTAMQDAFEREATAIRTAISETDWSETAVLDVVVFRPPIDEPATTASRERLTLALHHSHLPALEAAGVVRHDRTHDLVEGMEEASRLGQVLERVAPDDHPG